MRQQVKYTAVESITYSCSKHEVLSALLIEWKIPVINAESVECTFNEIEEEHDLNNAVEVTVTLVKPITGTTEIKGK